MRFGSKAFWLGVAVGFVGAVLVLIVLSIALLWVPGSGSAGQSTTYEPISLERAHQLIDGGQVYLVAIRKEGNIDEYFLFEETSRGHFQEPDPSRVWNVDGVDVHVFTESMSTGVPILSDDQDKVGLTSAQFVEFMERVEQYNAAASSPIEVLDQRTQSNN